MPTQAKLASRVFQVVLMAALIFFCFCVPLLILAGVDLPFSPGRRMRRVLPDIYLSIWWGRIIYAAIWLALGWLIFWFVVRRTEKDVSPLAPNIRTGWPIRGRLRNRAPRNREVHNAPKVATPDAHWGGGG